MNRCFVAFLVTGGPLRFLAVALVARCRLVVLVFVGDKRAERETEADADAATGVGSARQRRRGEECSGEGEGLGHDRLLEAWVEL